MKRMYEAVEERDVRKLYTDFADKYPGLPKIKSFAKRGNVITLYLSDEYEEEEVDILRQLFLDPLEQNYRVKAEYDVEEGSGTFDVVPVIKIFK